MTGQHTFLSKVTSRGADMFRAVSLCFLFIHKQRPTVITPSFKYQRPPLKESQRWPLVRAHDFSWKTHPRGGNFYSMQAQRFSSLRVYFRLPYIQNNRNIPKHALLILLYHILTPKVALHWKVPSEGQCSLPPSCLVTLVLRYTLTDFTTHPPWFYFTTGSQSLTL